MKALATATRWLGQLFGRFKNWVSATDDLGDQFAYLRLHRCDLTEDDRHFVLLMEENVRNGVTLSEGQLDRINEIISDLNSQLAW